EHDQHGEHQDRELVVLHGELGVLHGITLTAAPSSRYAAPSVTTRLTPASAPRTAACSPRTKAISTGTRFALPSGPSANSVARSPSASSSASIGTVRRRSPPRARISTPPISPDESPSCRSSATSTAYVPVRGSDAAAIWLTCPDSLSFGLASTRMMA